MKASYEFDLDPRYGWASVDLEGLSYGMIVVHSTDGSYGFNFHDGKMIPTCICNAYLSSECCCKGVDWIQDD